MEASRRVSLFLRMTAVAVIVAAALLGASCAAATTVLDVLGATVLEVDASGHFREDIVYTYTSFTREYKADGSFEELDYFYEGPGVDFDGDGESGEGDILIWGSRGTYRYDPALLELRVDESSRYYGASYELVGGSYELVYDPDADWEDVDPGQVVVSTVMLSTRNELGVYMADPDDPASWVTEDQYYFHMGTTDEYSFRMRVVQTFDDTAWSESWVAEEHDSDGTKRVTDEWLMSGEIVHRYPSDSSFAEGQVFTLYVLITEDRERWVDYGTGELGDWYDYTTGYEEWQWQFRMTVHHFGDYICIDCGICDAARALAPLAGHQVRPPRPVYAPPARGTRSAVSRVLLIR